MRENIKGALKRRMKDCASMCVGSFKMNLEEVVVCPMHGLRTNALTSLSICRIKYGEPGNRIKRALFSTFSHSRIRRRAPR